jgi:hypothetical protein
MRKLEALHGNADSQGAGRGGELWQVEQFDHLVRSEGQFEYCRRYIAENPLQARLQVEAYRWYSKALPCVGDSRLGETRLR